MILGRFSGHAIFQSVNHTLLVNLRSRKCPYEQFDATESTATFFLVERQSISLRCIRRTNSGEKRTSKNFVKMANRMTRNLARIHCVHILSVHAPEHLPSARTGRPEWANNFSHLFTPPRYPIFYLGSIRATDIQRFDQSS